MANEEIIVKLGADTGPLDTALRKMKSSVADAGEHSHRSFLHAQSGARGFHRVIHEISAQSPIMGGALQLALNPIVGTFAVATLAIGYFHEKFKEMAREAKEFGDWAAKPTANLEANLHKAAKAVDEVKREFDKWLKSQEDSPAKKIMEGLHDSQAKLNFRAKLAKEADPANAAQIEKNRLELEWTMQRDTMAKIRKEKLKNAEEIDTIQRDLEMKSGETRIERAKQFNEVETQLQEKLKKKQEAEVEDNPATALLKGATTLGAWGAIKAGIKTAMGIGPSGSELATITKSEGGLSIAEQLKASKARMAANNKAIENETYEHKLVSEKLKEKQAKQGELKSNFDTLSNSMEASRLALTAYPGTKVGAPIDTMHQAWNDQKSDFYKKFQEQKDAAYAPLHPYAQQTKDALGQIVAKQNSGKSTQELLRDIDSNIDALLQTATGKGLIINNK